MIPKPRDWDDVVRRKTAKSEEAYQRKMDAVFKALGIDPTKGTPRRIPKPSLFTDPPVILTEEESKAYDEYYETKMKEKI